MRLHQLATNEAIRSSRASRYVHAKHTGATSACRLNIHPAGYDLTMKLSLPIFTATLGRGLQTYPTPHLCNPFPSPVGKELFSTRVPKNKTLEELDVFSIIYI